MFKKWGSRYLVRFLAGMPGVPAKGAQLFSAILGESKVESAHYPKPMSTTKVKSILKKEAPKLLGQIIDDSDSAFSCATVASLGQLHQFKLQNGQTCAVKVRFPGLSQTLPKQVKRLMGIAKMGPASKYGFNKDAYQMFFTASFLGELDYLEEAQTQTVFKEAYKDFPEFVIPKVWPEYSSKQVLCQDFEPSMDLSLVLKLSHEHQLKCAKLLTQFLILGLFNKGMVHTDLHESNWGYRREDQKLVIYDFGSALLIGDDHRVALAKWLSASQNKEAKNCFLALVDLGFDSSKLKMIQDELGEICHRIVLGLLHGQYPSQYLVSKEHEWVFRMAGPPWFLLLMRSVNYVFLTLKKLGAQDVLDSSLVETITGKIAPNAHFLASPVLKTKLVVSVTEGTRQIVKIDLPVSALEQIESLMPESALESLGGLGIDLDKVREKVRATKFEPQNVIETSDPIKNRTYRIWIE